MRRVSSRRRTSVYDESWSRSRSPRCGIRRWQELAGRVAVVTGSARNIGRAIALALAQAGAAVIVNARTSAPDAEAVAEEIRAAGGRAAVKMADVADPDQAAALDRGGRRSASAGSTSW